MLIGRSAHQKSLDAALAQASAGTATVTVLCGDPGSGKTELLAYAARSASPDALILRASGHPAESDLPYAGLQQLLSSMHEAITELPAPQSTALARALALEPGEPGDRLATASALLRIVVTASERQPVVLVVDDVQWLDTSSRQALIFVARRIEVDRVAMFLGVRTAIASEFDGVGTSISVGPLSEDDARELLRIHYPNLSSMVAARVMERAAGLPLALTEIPAELTAGQRAGREALPARFPVGQFIERLYQARLEELDDRGRMALLLASFEDLDDGDLAHALEQCGLDLADLDVAERTHLIRLDGGRCVFTHPTVRAAIQNVSSAAERFLVHGVLAELFADDPARRAAHLSGRSTGPDESVAMALAAAAEQAALQGGLAESARNWQLAAVRTADPESRRDYRERAVQAFLRAGIGPPALALLHELIAEATRREDLARWQCLRTVTSMWADGAPPEDGDELAALGRELCTEGQLELGCDLLMALASCLLIWGDYRRGRELADTVRTFRAPAQLPLGHRLMGEILDVMAGAENAGTYLRSDWLAEVPAESFADPSVPVGFAGMTLGWMDEVEACDRVAQRCREMMQDHGGFAAAKLSWGPLAVLVIERRGEWDRAGLEYANAERLAIDGDFTAPYPYIALRHAYLSAAQGNVDECQELRRRSAQFARQRSPALAHLDSCVLGLLHLTNGDHAAAAEVLAEGGRLEQQIGAVNSGFTSRFVDYFESLWHLGRERELVDELTRFESDAQANGHPTAVATAARCRALLADADDLDAAFAATMTLHKASPNSFETARTLLRWGQRLRRARRKGDARVKLLEAHDEFERMGAHGWLVRTRSELAACGDRRTDDPRASAGPLSVLTPREFEVAQAVATGASNVVVAEQLFISLRTVEYHLSSVYRKLAVNDRNALGAMFVEYT